MAQINIKIDDDLKEDVNRLFNEMGLDMTTGIKIYLKRVQQEKKIPFPLTSQQYDSQTANQKQPAVDSLNDLFTALNQQKQHGGIGGAILDNHHKGPANGGIGGSILKKR